MSTKNFHIPLNEETYRELKHAAKEERTAATKLGRKAITKWLERRKKRRVFNEIRAFAIRNAGTDIDLDKQLETAGIESMLNNTQYEER